MNRYIEEIALPDLPLWDRLKKKNTPLFFELELTPRCNNNCRHCYINQPVSDKSTQQRELTLSEIEAIVDQAIEMGSLWCLITGGEPLVRKDFKEVYMMLKRKGLLLSLFTNATLITEEHVSLLKEFPPRDIEVTMYGATEETYEAVSRLPGSFIRFKEGLSRLFSNNIPVRLKAMALQSNQHELEKMAGFCRKHSKGDFRFDPFLHLRYDRNPIRNEEIRKERLTPQQIIEIEKRDKHRQEALKNNCTHLIIPEFNNRNCSHLFHCDAGKHSFTISYDGKFKLCSSLNHPECTYDLKTGTLAQAWNEFAPSIRCMYSDNPVYLENCRKCEIINLCLWCPANADLEVGQLDMPVTYFCDAAKARSIALRSTMNENK